MGSSFYRQALIQRQHGVASPVVTAVMPPGVNTAAPEGMRLSFSIDIENDTITVINGPGAGRTMSLSKSLDTTGFINADLPEQGFTHIIPGE
jgi:hypothetical protein